MNSERVSKDRGFEGARILASRIHMEHSTDPLRHYHEVTDAINYLIGVRSAILPTLPPWAQDIYGEELS